MPSMFSVVQRRGQACSYFRSWVDVLWDFLLTFELEVAADVEMAASLMTVGVDSVLPGGLFSVHDN